ncbi:MAG TPA: sigma-70 family RNA polymerase sigma factor [Gemmatimonadaceae bacterium]|nr:sigma-70 family RNA polymerase sigma factor [Gemmatimonadaceae bacterium]
MTDAMRDPPRPLTGIGEVEGTEMATTIEPARAGARRAAPAKVPLADAPPAVEDEAARRERFEAEVVPYLDALYSFALKLTRARDEAEDLVSDTVLRAFDRWEQYRLGSNIRAWLFTILYHTFVSRKRRVDAREVQLPEDEGAWGTYAVVGEADPERRFFDSFIDEEVTRAVAALPTDYRAAVVLSDVHGLRYAEIAEVLGIPEGTVKSRLFRGRRLLQHRLRGYATEMGYVKPPTPEPPGAPPVPSPAP